MTRPMNGSEAVGDLVLIQMAQWLSICLPPMWAGFDSRTRRRMWVEFVVGSRPFSERFFSGYSGFPLSFPNSRTIWNPRATSLLVYYYVPPSLNKHYLFLFDLLFLSCKSCCCDAGLTSLHFNKKSKEVCIKTRSSAVSLPAISQVTQPQL